MKTKFTIQSFQVGCTKLVLESMSAGQVQYLTYYCKGTIIERIQYIKPQSIELCQEQNVDIDNDWKRLLHKHFSAFI